MLFRKPLLLILFTTALLIVGFLYLLRGCLAKYDERAALTPVLYFSKGEKEIVFSLVKFEKATSYSQRGSFVSKTVSTSYYIQSNDALTGARLSIVKVKDRSDIKSYPVELLGASGGMAWAFIGELMAFDPFTLETKADAAILEKKNPSLENMFPAERRFYTFHQATGTIDFTARDGTKWKLDVNGIASRLDDSEPEDENAEAKRLETLIKENQLAQDSLMEQKLRRPSRLLSENKISIKQYREMMVGFNEDRSRLYARRDSLYRLRSIAQQKKRGEDDLDRRIASLSGRNHLSFNQLKGNTDTFAGKWLGVYTKDEAMKNGDRVRFEAAYGEAARRQLLSTIYHLNNSGDALIVLDSIRVLAPARFYLEGGFLLDKKTALPLRLPDGTRLVIYKNQVGNDGRVMVSRVHPDGREDWQVDTGLKEWADWILGREQLIVFGTDNKELTSGDINVFLGIDLATGKTYRYDYFTDRP